MSAKDNLVKIIPCCPEEELEYLGRCDFSMLFKCTHDRVWTVTAELTDILPPTPPHVPSAAPELPCG